MKKPTMIAGLTTLIIFCFTPLFATDYRNYCRKYHRNINLHTCVSQQEGAHRSIKSGRYSKEATESCAGLFEIRDRLVRYTDWVSYQQCAKEAQKDIDRLATQNRNTSATRRNTHALEKNNRELELQRRRR